MSQKGQLILTLILVMAVALVIGLSVIQKSLTDVSTSTKVEQSSRAFSIAEAGIEKALQGGGLGLTFNETGAKAEVIGNASWGPELPAVNTRQAAIEYPPLSKEDIAQVWLADPEADLPNCTVSNTCYKQQTLDIYWGSSEKDPAAIELTLVYFDNATSIFNSKKWYLDQNITRSPDNGFKKVTVGSAGTDRGCNGGYSPIGSTNTYQCRVTIGNNTDAGSTQLPSSGLMLIRARLLYNTNSQPFAVQSSTDATAACLGDCSLPTQTKSLTSTGSAGENKRKVKLFQEKKVVPPYFDYAIFSAGDIKK